VDVVPARLVHRDGRAAYRRHPLRAAVADEATTGQAATRSGATIRIRCNSTTRASIVSGPHARAIAANAARVGRSTAPAAASVSRRIRESIV
jgi:hypothetical protein